ncbi:MAG: hypothetical protein QXN34_06915 [Archaeoglobaceae archaeon]
MKIIIPFRLIINVPSEREEIYSRIKALLSKVEFIVNNTDDEKIQLRAIECAVKIASFLEGVLKDVQLDELEKQVTELERAVKAG